MVKSKRKRSSSGEWEVSGGAKRVRISVHQAMPMDSDHEESQSLLSGKTPSKKQVAKTPVRISPDLFGDSENETNLTPEIVKSPEKKNKSPKKERPSQNIEDSPMKPLTQVVPPGRVHAVSESESDSGFITSEIMKKQLPLQPVRKKKTPSPKVRTPKRPRTDSKSLNLEFTASDSDFQDDGKTACQIAAIKSFIEMDTDMESSQIVVATTSLQKGQVTPGLQTPCRKPSNGHVTDSDSEHEVPVPPNNPRRRGMRYQPPLRVRKVDLETSIEQLGPDQEIWQIRVPKNFDVRKLVGHTAAFNDTVNIKVDEEDGTKRYQLHSQAVHRKHQPSTAFLHMDPNTNGLKLAGHPVSMMWLTEHEAISPPRAPRPAPFRKTKLPAGLKRRHVPFGAGTPELALKYMSQPRSTEGVRTRHQKMLMDSVENNSEKKIEKVETDIIEDMAAQTSAEPTPKKKKKKKNKEEKERVESEEPPEVREEVVVPLQPETLETSETTKKKKKKKKHKKEREEEMTEQEAMVEEEREEIVLPEVLTEEQGDPEPSKKKKKKKKSKDKEKDRQEVESEKVESEEAPMEIETVEAEPPRKKHKKKHKKQKENPEI